MILIDKLLIRIYRNIAIKYCKIEVDNYVRDALNPGDYKYRKECFDNALEYEKIILLIKLKIAKEKLTKLTHLKS